MVNNKQSFIQVQDQPVTKKYKQIYKDDIICLQKVASKITSSDVPWKYSFELKTNQRIYQLYAPTAEERDLWVAGINRVMNVPVDDPAFIPVNKMSTHDLEAEEVTMTEGNNNNQSQRMSREREP